jgi:hypothetical protein
MSRSPGTAELGRSPPNIKKLEAAANLFLTLQGKLVTRKIGHGI